MGFGPWKRLGRSKIVNCLGEIVDSVDHAEEAIINAKLTNQDLALQRAGFNLFMDRIPSAYGRITKY